MVNWFDWTDLSTIQQESQVHTSSDILLHKMVEAIPQKTVTSKEMIEFVKEHIVYRFGIPQTITTDQGSMFISEEFYDSVQSF